MVPVSRFSASALGRLFGVLAVLSAGSAAVALLLPNPLADAFFAAWVLGSVAVSVVAAAAAWANRTPLAWAGALLLAALSILGMWSVGLLVAPAAAFALGAALCSQLSGPRSDVRRAIVAEPPSVQESALKALAGLAAVVLGGSLVYASAVAGGLFEACAAETVVCVVERTHWDAVAVTVVGLSALVLGGWTLWRQVYVARVLAAEQPGR